MAAKFTDVKISEPFCARAQHLACAALLAALAGASPSMAQPDAAPKATPDAPTLTGDELTALSNVTLPVQKAAATAVSGLTVTARKSTGVSELTVTVPLCPQARDKPDPEGRPPKLLSSYPVRNSTVRQGVVILRLTFDKPMTCGGLLDNRVGFVNPCPAPLIEPLFSRDRRTFVTVCVVSPIAEGLRRYGLNLDKFTSLSGQPLKPSGLDFFVDADSPPVETAKEAMTHDPFLRDAQAAAERRR